MKAKAMWKASFSMEEIGCNAPMEKGRQRRWLSCGDYQIWDIECFRNAIIKRYGPDAVSEMKVDDEGRWYFEQLIEVDESEVSRDVGVRHSGPSESSSSSTVDSC